MGSPAGDIASYLESSAVNVGSIGAASGWSINVSKFPDSPDSVIGIFDTSGEDPTSNIDYRRPTIQVRVRGGREAYLAGYLKAEAIFNALDGLHGEIIGSYRYIGIWAMGDILFLSYDEKERPMFSMNFRIHRTTNS